MIRPLQAQPAEIWKLPSFASFNSPVAFRWVPCAIVCGALTWCFVVALQPDHVLAAGHHAAHRYSAYDPSWTQLVFPRLGTPAAPPTSLTALATRLVQSRSTTPERRLAMLAMIAHVVALVMFCIVLWRLGAGPVITAMGVIALGLQPAFFSGATTWTPYLMLPALLMGFLAAGIRWVETRRARWTVVLAAVSLCAIAESLYVLPILASLPAWPGGPVWYGRNGRRWWRATGAAGIVAIGLALHVIGAAATWREAASSNVSGIPSWWDAFVAVTTRWGRLLEIYLTLVPFEQVGHWIGATAKDLGLLGGILALLGVFWQFRERRTETRLLLSMLLAAFAIGAFLVTPVSTISPADVTFVALILIFGAHALGRLSKAVRSPTSAIAFLGGVIAVHAFAAQRLNAILFSAIGPATLTSMVAALPHPASLVAGNVERDRRLEYLLTNHPAASQIVRIPQSPSAIRQALRPLSHTFVWAADRKRVTSLGFALAPIHITSVPGSADNFLYEVLDTTPCAQSRSDDWFDVTVAAQKGAIGLQADRGAPYEMELQAEGTSAARVQAFDVWTHSALPVVDAGAQHIRIAVHRPRRSLPLIQFENAPSRARGRVAASHAGQIVKVCGAPIRGAAIGRWPHGTSTALRLEDEATFTDGWHPPEPGAGGQVFRWSSATTATVHVQLPTDVSTLEIEVDAAPALAPQRSPTLTFEVNGRLLPSRPMQAGNATYTWTLSGEVVHGGLNAFRLHVPDVVSPRSAGLSGDPRSLGLALTAFRLRRPG